MLAMLSAQQNVVFSAALGVVVLIGGGHSRQHLGFIEQKHLVGRLFTARTEHPMARQNELLEQVIDTALGFGQFAMCLGKMLLRLGSDCSKRRLLLAHQRLQRNRIARQFTR